MSDQLLMRTGLLLEITERKKNKGRLGKTSVMKLLYLLQEGYGIDLGYSFSLYTYGPYDSAVMGDIDYASNIGVLDVKYQGDRGYEIKSGEDADQIKDYQNEFKKKHSDSLEALFNHFGQCNAKELELRSTLVLIANDNPKITNEKLIEVLKKVKPRFSDDEIGQAIDDLRQSGIWERIDAKYLVTA